MQLVGKGGQITLWIPANMAYGSSGSNSIGPNEALQFKVELHDIITPEAAEEK
jgi:FKBP-type peptidyl-prolyl cis-trans isomerase FkpA